MDYLVGPKGNVALTKIYANQVCSCKPVEIHVPICIGLANQFQSEFYGRRSQSIKNTLEIGASNV